MLAAASEKGVRGDFRWPRRDHHVPRADRLACGGGPARGDLVAAPGFRSRGGSWTRRWRGAARPGRWRRAPASPPDLPAIRRPGQAVRRGRHMLFVSPREVRPRRPGMRGAGCSTHVVGADAPTVTRKSGRPMRNPEAAPVRNGTPGRWRPARGGSGVSARCRTPRRCGAHPGRGARARTVATGETPPRPAALAIEHPDGGPAMRRLIKLFGLWKLFQRFRRRR